MYNYCIVPIGSMYAIYGVTWIPSIYPSHVSIFTSTMDPMGYDNVYYCTFLYILIHFYTFFLSYTFLYFLIVHTILIPFFFILYVLSVSLKKPVGSTLSIPLNLDPISGIFFRGSSTWPLAPSPSSKKLEGYIIYIYIYV